MVIKYLLFSSLLTPLKRFRAALLLVGKTTSIFRVCSSPLGVCLEFVYLRKNKPLPPEFVIFVGKQTPPPEFVFCRKNTPLPPEFVLL